MATENAVSLKLPTFWTSQPLVWFAQAEAQFELRKITADETRYYLVLSALDQGTATRLLDLISNPPGNNKYEALTDRISGRRFLVDTGAEVSVIPATGLDTRSQATHSQLPMGARSTRNHS